MAFGVGRELTAAGQVGHSVGTSAQTTLPGGSGVQPHRNDRASTRYTPRPRILAGSGGRISGGSGEASWTFTCTTPPADSPTDSDTGPRAWSIVFDRSSVTTISVGSTASSVRPHSAS